MPPPNPTPNPFPRDSSFWVLPGGDEEWNHPEPPTRPQPPDDSSWVVVADEESKCADNQHPYRVLLHLTTKQVYRIPGPCRDPECENKVREAVMRGNRIVNQITTWVAYYHLPVNVQWTVLDGDDKRGYDRVRKQVYRSHNGRGWGMAHRMLLPSKHLEGLAHKTVIVSSAYDMERASPYVPTSANYIRRGEEAPICRSGDIRILEYEAIIPRLLLAKRPKIHTSRINLPTTDPVPRYGCPVCGGISWVNNLETCLLHHFPVRSNNLSLGWESKKRNKTIHTMLKEIGFKIASDGATYDTGLQVYKVKAIN